MKALILNSGIGKRLGILTADRPKCLVELAPGFTLLDLQLERLDEAGIRDLVITTGPFAEQVRDRVASRHPCFRPLFVHNPLFDSTNYIYSMHLAASSLNDDLLLMHGDVVFAPGLLEMLAARRGSAVLVDRAYPQAHKDFRARLEGGHVKEIGVGLDPADCRLLMPVYRLSKRALAVWLAEIARFVGRGDTGVYAENALNSVADRMRVKPLDLAGRFCMEVDTAEDLERARRALGLG